jgi:hypothetical protein
MAFECTVWCGDLSKLKVAIRCVPRALLKAAKWGGRRSTLLAVDGSEDGQRGGADEWVPRV